jgi:ATP-dependent Clp protease ATP-binding subunit ClpC
MWQRFTERARKVVFYAQEEAQKFNEGYISTEHLLLGLCRESDTVAGRVLERLEISSEQVRTDVESHLPRGDTRPSQDMTLTPRAKRVIDLAYDEARNLNNDYIGTEHLLLGLIREADGLAGRVLSKLGVTLEDARRVTIELQDGTSGDESGRAQFYTSEGYGPRRRQRKLRELMPMLLLMRQGRMKQDLLSIIMLSAENPATSVLFTKLEIDLDRVLESSEQLISRAFDHAYADQSKTLADILTFAREEAELAGQKLSPLHFVPALLRSEDNYLAERLDTGKVTLEALRAAIAEVGP